MKPLLNRRAFLSGLAVAATLPITTQARAADRDRANALGGQLMCLCGCGQPLVHCGMINCPKATPMRNELARHIEAGESDEQIMAFFIDKYGASVQAAGGALGQVAKVVSFAVLAGGAVAATMVVVRRWKVSSAAAGADAVALPVAGPEIDPKYRRRIEEDLEKLTPED